MPWKKAAPISIEHRYLLSKCNYGDVFKVHEHKKNTFCVCVRVDVDWKLNSRHQNWVCPFRNRREKKCVDSNHKSYTIKSHMHIPCQICCFASKDYYQYNFSFSLPPAFLSELNVLIMKVTCFNFIHACARGLHVVQNGVINKSRREHMFAGERIAEV